MRWEGFKNGESVAELYTWKECWEALLARQVDTVKPVTTCHCGMWPVEEYGLECPSCNL